MSIVVSEPMMLAGIPDDVYHGGKVRTPGPQTSQSALKLLIAPSTPREFQHRITTPQQPKRVFDVGHAAHSLVLGVGAEFVRHPDEEEGYLNAIGGWNSTKKSKDWIASQRAAGRIPLASDDYEAVYRMAESILAHGRASELVTDPDRKPEMSAYCEITEGLWLRSRFDLLGGGLVDFKTSSDPHPDAFRASAWKWGYHVQDVAYRRAYALITGETPGPMTFVVVGREAPHLVSIATLDPEFERLGNEQLDAAISVYLEQLAKHGAPDADGVTWDGLPEETAVLSPPRSAYYDAEGVAYEPTF